MFADILNGIEQRDPEDTIVPTKGICADCLWMDKTHGARCEAFPHGIPMEIILGVFDHHYHYAMSGVDDEGVVFTPLNSVQLTSKNI